MSRRGLHWLVLGFTTLWFGVLVPVHNRGEIALAGNSSHCAGRTDPSPATHCHAAADPIPSGEKNPDRGPPAKGACAVCFFIAGLDTPAPVTQIETRLGLIGATDAPAPEDLPAARVMLSFHSRAPPVA
jgi:hypothetical protein